jgi:hypothetical protein
MPVSRTFLYISLRVPSKAAPLHVPHTELPQSDRDAPFPGPSFTHLLESPVNKVKQNLTFLSKSLGKEPPPPSIVLQQGPYGEKCLISRASGLFISLRVPRYGALP